MGITSEEGNCGKIDIREDDGMTEGMIGEEDLSITFESSE